MIEMNRRRSRLGALDGRALLVCDSGPWCLKRRPTVSLQWFSKAILDGAAVKCSCIDLEIDRARLQVLRGKEGISTHGNGHSYWWHLFHWTVWHAKTMALRLAQTSYLVMLPADRLSNHCTSSNRCSYYTSHSFRRSEWAAAHISEAWSWYATESSSRGSRAQTIALCCSAIFFGSEMVIP